MVYFENTSLPIRLSGEDLELVKRENTVATVVT